MLAEKRFSDTLRSMDRPSFVFILADDLGYADLGCYGGRGAGLSGAASSCSPNLDRLAAQGLRFTDGYSNSPVCSPTRFALATGRYQYRLRGGADEPIASRTSRGSPVLGLPPAHPTLASLLRDAGYATALVGKWHLGFPPHFGPLKSGYQEFFGPLSGGVDYFTHCDFGGKHDLYDGEAIAEVEGLLHAYEIIFVPYAQFVPRPEREPSTRDDDPFYQWFLAEEDAFHSLWEKLTAEVFHLLFGNRAFLLKFNRAIAYWLAHHPVPPECLGPHARIARYSPS